MDINLEAEVQCRERRLGSVTGYDGTLKDLVNKGCGGCLRNRDRTFQTVSSCSHVHAINQLAGLDDTVVVDHAPHGCAGAQICFSLVKNKLPWRPGSTLAHARVFSTGITESDTIFGALDKVRSAVRAAYKRYHPGEIFIATSCVSAIIGEDVRSVAEEMEAELGIPVEVAAAEGLKSKIWASGFDAYCHAVSRSRVRKAEAAGRGGRTINYVGFNNMGREFVAPLFKRLGLDLICLTATATREDFARAAGSAASWGQCGSQSSYLCSVLEQECGIKYFQSHLPYGGTGFERFFLDIGRFLGKEDEAKRVCEEERAKYAPEVSRLKKVLGGKKALVAMGASFAFEYTRMLGELGVETLHAVAYHYDPHLDNKNRCEKIAAATDVDELGLDLPASVNDAQQVETDLVIDHYKPDFILSRGHDATPYSISRGIPALDVDIGLIVMGWRGLVYFGNTLEALLRNTSFITRLGEHYTSPFTDRLGAGQLFTFYEEAA